MRRRRRHARTRDGVDRRGVPRAPVIAVVVAALVAAVVLDRTEPDRDTAAARPLADVPSIPDAGALSASWYCAEGTAGEDERADETVLLANVGSEDAEAVVTVYDSSEDEQVRERVEVAAGEQVDVDVTEVTDEPELLLLTGTVVGPGVLVETFGGQVVVEHAVRRGDDLAVGACARSAAPDWYFAAGTTVRGTELMLSLFNPFGDDAIVDLTFLTDTGVQTPEGSEAVNVPRHTRVTIPLHEMVQRQAEVATLVRARTGRIVAEQLLASDGSEVAEGLALSLGSTAPAERWTFPYGLMGPDRTHTVTVANFAETGTEVEVTLAVGEAGEEGADDPANANGAGAEEPDATAAGGIEPQVVPLGPRSVSVVDVGGLVPAGTPYAVDVRVTGDAPVVAEELVTLNTDDEAGIALDAGGVEPAPRWAFAGLPDEDASATIVLFNPGSEAATASLMTFAEGAAAPGAAEVSIPPGARASFALDDLEIDASQVLMVEADRPVFAQRVVAVEGGRTISAGVPGR